MATALSSSELLLGIGLVLILAVGSQLVAKLLRVPAIVLLLTVGFVAGILTKDVQPSYLLGSLYQPFVSVAVGVILFEAGLRLTFREVTPRIRPTVVRLVSLGLLFTWLAVTVTVKLALHNLGPDVPFLIGAILVVSGPTVVLPLLAYIRPARDVRAVLKWEGVLIDPIGALLAVAVFQVARTGGSSGWHPGALALSLLVGRGRRCDRSSAALADAALCPAARATPGCGRDACTCGRGPGGRRPDPGRFGLRRDAADGGVPLQPALDRGGSDRRVPRDGRPAPDRDLVRDDRRVRLAKRRQAGAGRIARTGRSDDPPDSPGGRRAVYVALEPGQAGAGVGGVDGAARDRRWRHCVWIRAAAGGRRRAGSEQDPPDRVRGHLRNRGRLWPDRLPCSAAARGGGRHGHDGADRRRARTRSYDR